MIPFAELAIKLAAQSKRDPFTGSLLSFDPGHTTGWCIFKDLVLIESGEIDTTSIDKATDEVSDLINGWKPDHVVMEEYRVYEWRAKHHAGSDLLTARVIGTIETLCRIYKIPNNKQSAQVAKKFCTDSKLKDWDMWPKGQKHARDSIRHACYFLIFGPSKNKARKTNVG